MSFFNIWISNGSGTICWRLFFFPIHCLSLFVKNWPHMSLLLTWFYSTDLFGYGYGSIVSLKWDNYKFLLVLFFFKIVLALQGSLHFCTNFRISLSISTKRPNWDCDRDCIQFRDDQSVFQSIKIAYLSIYLGHL